MAAILSFATGIIIIKSRAIVNINFITPHFLTQLLLRLSKKWHPVTFSAL